MPKIDPAAIEQKRLFKVLYLFGGVGIFVLLAISLINHLQESDAFLLLTLPAAGLTLAAMIYMRISGNTLFTAHLFGAMMVALSLVLLVSGGVSGNGILWIYIFPPFLFFMVGLRCGLFYMLLIMALVIGVFYVPHLPLDHYRYPSQYKARFLLSLLGVSLISIFSEYSRYRTHLNLTLLAAKLERLSLEDELTGLVNRRGGLTHLHSIRDISLRTDLPFSLILGDIDHFKKVNDRFGHETGDLVLRQSAQSMREAIRRQDVLVRWGGEEFLCILPNTGLSGALRVAEKLRSAIAAKSIETGAGSLSVTASFGVAPFVAPEEIDVTLARADRLLYLAKERGRNRVLGPSSTTACD